MRNWQRWTWTALSLLSLYAIPVTAQDKPAAAPAAPADAPAKPPAAFELRDGDRVVFVGGTLIEREGQIGHIETLLTRRWPDRNITFRNLGQSGDTVQADARNLNAGWATFGPPDQGFKRLRTRIGEIKPTVVFANFGMTESFGGVANIPQFVKGYEQLLDMIAATAGGSPRIVLLSPNYHEPIDGMPDPAAHNAQLRAYRDAIRQLGEQRGYDFVDLYAIGEKLATEGNITANGIHPTADGFRRLGEAMLAALDVAPAAGASAHDDKLRQLIAAKNAEYFNYWRPQNDTYILGYRKKEQGRNAVEIPQFLPLVEAKEKEIRQLMKENK